MQNSLTSIQDVKDWVKGNEQAYWRIFSGYTSSQNSYIVASNMTNGNMDESLARLERTLKMYSNEMGGTFNILLNKEGNPKDNSGFRSNITLSVANSTPPSVLAGIGNIPTADEIEARIQKAVSEKEREMKRDYEHKAMIQGLKDEMEELRNERKNEWSFEKINGIVDTLLQNPIITAVVMKATGLGAIPTGLVQGENRTDDSQAVANDEKIDLAAETLESAGYQNSGDILLSIAQFIKMNPQKAMEMFNSVQNQTA